MIAQFFIVFKDYLIEVLLYLAASFFLSSLIQEFVPTGWVERHLGGKGIKPLIYSTLAGTAFPICCLGSPPGGGLVRAGDQIRRIRKDGE